MYITVGTVIGLGIRTDTGRTDVVRVEKNGFLCEPKKITHMNMQQQASSHAHLDVRGTASATIDGRRQEARASLPLRCQPRGPSGLRGTKKTEARIRVTPLTRHPPDTAGQRARRTRGAYGRRSNHVQDTASSVRGERGDGVGPFPICHWECSLSGVYTFCRNWVLGKV